MNGSLILTLNRYDSNICESFSLTKTARLMLYINFLVFMYSKLLNNIPRDIK